MLQDARLPSAQAGRTRGKQTRKQRALIRGRARAIPTETSHDRRSPLRRQGRFRRAREPRSLPAPMISEFPSLDKGAAGLGRGQLSHTARQGGSQRSREGSSPASAAIRSGEERASPLGQAGGDASADVAAPAPVAPPGQHQPDPHCGSPTCRAHLAGLCQETAPLWAPPQGSGALALCFHLKGSPASHRFILGWNRSRLCPLFSILTATRFNNINKAVLVKNISKKSGLAGGKV